jgi:hypothetical protein
MKAWAFCHVQVGASLNNSCEQINPPFNIRLTLQAYETLDKILTKLIWKVFRKTVQLNNNEIVQ